MSELYYGVFYRVAMTKSDGTKYSWEGNNFFTTKESAKRSVRGQKARYGNRYEYRVVVYKRSITLDEDWI